MNHDKLDCKKAARKRIERETKAFLKAGGKVTRAKAPAPRTSKKVGVLNQFKIQ